MSFDWPIRVYYEDTDAGGVVYHARYLHFLERARTEWLRHAGCDQRALAHEAGVIFAVRDLQIDFHRPARLDDVLRVHTEVAEQRRVSFSFDQKVFTDAAADGELLCHARVKVACLNAQSFAPQAIPESISSALAAGAPPL